MHWQCSSLKTPALKYLQFDRTNIAYKTSEDVAKLIYLGKKLKGQNCIHDENKRGLNSENACSHSIQNISSSSLINKKAQIRTHTPTSSPPVIFTTVKLGFPYQGEMRDW
jgi:hypothetical protein